MPALPQSLPSTGASPDTAAPPAGRCAATLWLALQLLEPGPDAARLESLASWAASLTSIVVLRPGEGLLLELHGSLRYFSGLTPIRERLAAELERRGLAHRSAIAPTPLAASWLARAGGADSDGQTSLAGAIGRLPLAATAWPEKLQLKLGQMGIRTIADCLRLPRAGFARRVGKLRLDELDRALGLRPDPQTGWQAVGALRREVEFSFESRDRALFARALEGLAASLEDELRRRQAQVDSITLRFRHLRCDATCTRIRFVEPVHEAARMLGPLQARIERIELAGPAIGLVLGTSVLQPLRTRRPGLLPARADDPPGSAAGAVSEFALVEALRGRFGARSVYGISAVAEHRPEYAWRRRLDAAGRPAAPAPACPPHGRPLWLLPPRKRGQSPFSEKKGSDPFFASPERIESGWWDGHDVRRDYHVVIGPAGEKLWCYRDCRTREWYLHGIFG